MSGRREKRLRRQAMRETRGIEGQVRHNVTGVMYDVSYRGRLKQLKREFPEGAFDHQRQAVLDRAQEERATAQNTEMGELAFNSRPGGRRW